MKRAQWIGVLAFVLAPDMALAGGSASRDLDTEIMQLRAETAAINADLVALEEAVLFPADTRLAVYLSLERDALFQIDAIELSIDGRPARAYLYSPQERRALAEGGVQRLYLDNISRGEHSISATLKGRDAEGRDIQKEQQFQFVKGHGTESFQLSVKARASTAEPHLAIRRWQ